jgi:hypothetical protein
MLKFATAQVMSKVLIPQNVGRREMQRIAHRHHFDYEVRPGFLYVRSRAISSRCNDNFDEFPAEELEKAYATFKGKPVFVNHVNHDHKRARGVIIDAALHKDSNRDGSKDHWVEVLMEVDALRFPKLAQEILNGNIARTSMGCDVAFSICSACGNKATSPAEYCTHIPAAKGQRIYRHVGSGKKVGELIRETCYGLKFFENSLLVEPPADPTAHFLGVDTSGMDKTASAGTMTVRPKERSVRRDHGDGDPPEMEGWGGGDGDAKNNFLVTRHRPDYYSLTNNVHDSHPNRHVSYHYSVEDALHQLGHLKSRGTYLPGEVRYAPKMGAKRTGSLEPEFHNHYGKWFDKNSPNHDPNPRIEPSHEDMSDDELKHHMEGWHSEKPGRDATMLRAKHHEWHQTNDLLEGSQGPGEDPECMSSVGEACNYRSPGGHTHAPSFKGMFGDSDLSGLFDEGSGPSKFSSLTQLFTQMDPKTASLTVEAAPAHANPGDHPWFKQVPLSHENVISHWEQSTPEEKQQGARWYPDAHHVAKAIAKLNPDIKDDREASHKGAGVLSAYSPQQGWWANQHNAARSFLNKKAVGKGEGIMVMSSHATAAQKILDGEDHQKALKGPKTQDFAHLIEHGGNDEKGNPSHRVVVDRHALSVAAGRRLDADDVKGFPSQNRHYYEHVAQQYRTAAAVLSDREGRQIPPHEVQAVTWLTRQRLNAEGEDSPGQKGRNTVQRNQRKTWQDMSKEHTPDLHDTDPPNSHVSKKTLTQLFAEAAVVPPFSGESKFAANQEGGEMPAFPWDKVPKINLPMTQKGWDDPRRQKMYDAKGERDLLGPAPAGPYQSLIDKLPDHAEQELSNPHGMGAADAGRSSKPRDNYPGDKREQWARSRWDNVKWPNWTDHNGRPSTPQEQLASKRNIRKRWSQTWKKPLACEHDSCPPWAHGGDAMTLSPERQQEADNHAKAFDVFMNGGEEESKKESSRKHAYGETKAPQDVDTLRDDACPVCGDRDTFEGANCQVCGYVAPPKMFQDPDLEVARQMDLRKDIAEFNGQPGQPVDPNSLDPNGNPVNPDAADPNAQPGSLPGEVQAEVQPGGDVMDPNALDPNGMPMQQPQQQMMLGPNGEPLGPQELPPGAMTDDGKPFTPGPNVPLGPGEPGGPEGPLDPESLDEDGQMPNPAAGGGAPGTPEDGVPDLMCPACGFTADASQPVSVDMDTANLPDTGMATPDAVAAGDVCPNCQGGLLVSPAEEQGQVPVPVPM